MIIEIENKTNKVTIYPNPNFPPTPKENFTVREVEFLPLGKGLLQWNPKLECLERAIEEKRNIPTLSARQLRLWILENGIGLENIEAQINAIKDTTSRAKALIEWEYATEYKRNHPLVNQLGAALKLTSEQIDQAFATAALL